MQRTGFVICDSAGMVEFELNEDILMSSNHLIPNQVNFFDDKQDAIDVMNGLPGTAAFEGVTGLTVRAATLTVGTIVAEQDPLEDEDE